jgi:hypothetical protein
MSRKKKFGRRRSRYRLWYALGVTYCWSFFLNLTIYVIRISYIDTLPADPDVTVGRCPPYQSWHHLLVQFCTV